MDFPRRRMVAAGAALTALGEPARDDPTAPGSDALIADVTRLAVPWLLA